MGINDKNLSSICFIYLPLMLIYLKTQKNHLTVTHTRE